MLVARCATGQQNRGMDARARLATCIAIGVIAFIPTVMLTAWQVAVLVGWDATAAAFLVLI